LCVTEGRTIFKCKRSDRLKRIQASSYWLNWQFKYLQKKLKTVNKPIKTQQKKKKKNHTQAYLNYQTNVNLTEEFLLEKK